MCLCVKDLLQEAVNKKLGHWPRNHHNQITSNDYYSILRAVSLLYQYLVDIKLCKQKTEYFQKILYMKLNNTTNYCCAVLLLNMWSSLYYMTNVWYSNNEILIHHGWTSRLLSRCILNMCHICYQQQLIRKLVHFEIVSTFEEQNEQCSALGCGQV